MGDRVIPNQFKSYLRWSLLHCAIRRNMRQLFHTVQLTDVGLILRAQTSQAVLIRLFVVPISDPVVLFYLWRGLGAYLWFLRQLRNLLDIPLAGYSLDVRKLIGAFRHLKINVILITGRALYRCAAKAKVKSWIMHLHNRGVRMLKSLRYLRQWVAPWLPLFKSGSHDWLSHGSLQTNISSCRRVKEIDYNKLLTLQAGSAKETFMLPFLEI